MANIKGKQLSSNLAVTNVTASGHISGSNTSTGSFAHVVVTSKVSGSSVTTGSFGNVRALRSITAADISASVIQASQGTIDIHSLSGYVANENIDHSSVTITAGSGLTGGGDITSTRTLAVGAGTGVTVNANDVAIGQAVAASSTPTFAGLTLTGNLISDSIISGSRIATTGQITGSTISASVVQATQGTINHDSLAGFVANEHINHTSVDITAGAGLTGGGDISSTRTLAVGAGTGITVNANDVAIGQAVSTTSDVKFANITGSIISGSSLLGVVGTATQGTINHDSLSGFVADEHVAHGDVTITAGAGLTGGGTIASTRTLAVGAGTGVTVNANDVAIGQAVSTTSNVLFANITGSIISGSSLLGVVGTATQGTIDHDGLANFVANEHIDHSAVSVTAGDGLTGGGTIAANRTINVVGGDGITANANDVAVTAAQTAITSLINSSLTKIGTATDQEYIKFDTSNEVNVHINNSEKLSVTAAGANVTGDFAASATSSAAHILVTGIISGSQIEASGDVIAFSSSDRRFKDNLVVIEGSLDKIGKINGYEFDWNDKQTAYKGHDIGVVAQEIEAVLPEVVTTRGDGYKAVKYDKIVPLLIESIKELQKKVEDIEKNCDCLNK